MTHGVYNIALFAASFAIIAIASKQIGRYVTDRLSLPLITGFLLTGIIAGPCMLNLITPAAVAGLKFIDEVALSFIAFAAGNALYTKDLKTRAESIKRVTGSLVVFTFLVCGIAVFLMAGHLPFAAKMTKAGRVAVAILAASIFVARSPSTVIAVVNELRAKGPFTQTVLGVTMISDVVVIALFATCLAIADALFTGFGIDPKFVVVLLAGLLLSAAAGYLTAKVFMVILSARLQTWIKTGLILLSGYGIYASSETVRLFSAVRLPFEIVPEPLLICMIAGFIVSNYCDCKLEFSKILSDAGPPVYIAFFTLTGASLELDVLVHTWHIALALLLVRVAAIGIGAFAGGVAAKDPARQNRIGWMAYITQAGVSLGLAKAVVVEFPAWGGEFATTMIAIIVLNQIIGPPLLKQAITLAGEAHPKGTPPVDYERHEALIFGLEPQSLALGRLLAARDWTVRIACLEPHHGDSAQAGVKICNIPDLTLGTLERLNAARASAIVTMMSDDENYRVCELAYEHFGTATLVVRLNNRAGFDRFHRLGALVVDPNTALAGLMDQFVRSPSAASLLLGMEKGQEVAQLEVRNPNLHGLALRELRLPIDTIILSIHRQGHAIISHGYTRLEIGDMVTIVGPPERLKEVELRFDTDREQAIAYLVEKTAPKELGNGLIKEEAGQIIAGGHTAGKASKSGEKPMDRFDRFIEQSIVIDLPERTDAKQFFKIAAKALSDPLGVEPDTIYNLLLERESQSSTAITRGLAIPHIIVEKTSRFSILLARCREGIWFSEQAPMVPAVFVLAGPKGERTFHLQALAAIAQIVQSPNFEKRWLRAKDGHALRKVVLFADRKRVV